MYRFMFYVIMLNFVSVMFLFFVEFYNFFVWRKKSLEGFCRVKNFFKRKDFKVNIYFFLLGYEIIYNELFLERRLS